MNKTLVRENSFDIADLDNIIRRDVSVIYLRRSTHCLVYTRK